MSPAPGFLDRPADWQPLVALQKFLEAGPPPVYVGFGSGGRGGVKRAQIVLEALALARQRGVLARGWGGLQATDPARHNLYAGRRAS